MYVEEYLLKAGVIMMNYAFNDSIGYFEIDPLFLEEGVQIAEKENYHSIRIRNLNPEVDLKCHLDFASFNNKTFINKLRISSNFKLSKYQNTEALSTLTNLTEITLAQPINLDLSYFKKLEEVVVKKDHYLNLDKLVNVKSLYAIKYMKPDCKEFGSLNSLEFLRLDTSAKLISLTGIEDLDALKWCWFQYLNHLEDAHALSELNGLERLQIEKCKQLTDLTFLTGNRTIKELQVSDVDSLEFVKSMNNLEKINFWNCKSGDLSPLLECPSLREVSFHPDKRHYSHKKDEINNLLQERNSI
ncbi:hypothetical protein ABEW50_20265 [Paenibacillus jamilae]|uniref:Uncharacterized protein n=1 Tax=Paenibacillus alvei TaxID=44250 RepID=A0ABT4E6K7_PAEAL|nr:hypothetical protein [Paenibacillus alvei]MCY9529365.1 hypothetical protein [Paenibacillus alvei]